MDGTLRVHARRERDEIGGSHDQSTDEILRVGDYTLSKAREVIDAADDVGVEPCRGDQRFEQAGSCLHGGRRVVLDCVE